MATTKPWWQDVITQAFNPPVEPGEDIGTPFHSQVTALESGRIESVSYGGFGVRIDEVVGSNTVVYYQHLDELAPGLHAGSQITAGQLLGLSGGQLSGGEHPNSPLNSTGPHIEVGEIVNGQPVNPATLIAAGPQLGTGSGGGPSTTQTAPQWWELFLSPELVAASQAAPTVDNQLGQAAGNAAFQAGAGYVSGVVAAAQGIGSSQLGPWLQKNMIPLVVAGLIVLIVLGLGNKSTNTQTQPVPIPVPV
jgi:hypothetical protein